MPDRDWERELAEIDRRLGSIPDKPTPAAPERGRTVAGGPPPGAATVAAVSSAAAERRTIGTPAPGRRGWRTQLALLLRVLVSTGIVAALLYWPYPSRCGVQLGYYLALVVALALTGLWTSVAAWRHRAAFVHLLGLATLVAAAVLGAREVLPKTGYALPTPAHPAAWSCA
jgi:hypothetical protein